MRATYVLGPTLYHKGVRLFNATYDQSSRLYLIVIGNGFSLFIIGGCLVSTQR